MDDSELFYDAVDLLKALIAIDRVSRNETAAADELQRRLISYGLQPRRHVNNLWVIDPDFDPARKTILLNSHIDTVPVADGWTRDPHKPLLTDDERLYGLGSNDAGASLVTLLAVFRLLIESPRNVNFIFLASAEEEVSGANGIESVIPMLPPIDFAIVGEPTGMKPAIAEKGLMVLDGVVSGVAGHAARNEGINAIYRAVDVIDRLRNLELPRVSPTLGPVKISVTGIEAGSRHNIIPGECRIMVDVRTTDAYTNPDTLELIRAAAGEHCTLTPRSTRLRPSSVDPSHPVVARAVMLGAEPFGSPTLSDQALLDIPSVKIGPGDSARSHTANEYITLPELRHALATYHRLLHLITLP